ncbi:MAG: hypothetical protein L6Q37_06650 [Bdellovibrionaceae bacterium]|nr:hypothetical protein [Pseudobdellovibrionaceae bacterium]NUM57272.1 hypothetical protein [Pseudobdellovibrionaceae bacterium]
MKTSLLILLLLCVFHSFSSYSQTVQKIGKTEILFQLNDRAVEKDQEFFVVDSTGKKRALVKVTVFNSQQAKAKIIKGKVEDIKVGMRIADRSPANIGETTTAQGLPSGLKSKYSWGALGSYMMNSMNAKFSYNNTNQTASMSGSGFGALGYFDYTLNKDLQIRALGGLEQFSAKQSKETAVCAKGTSGDCNVSISYLSMYGVGKYNITKSKNKFWVGAGMGYLMAMSKSSTVLDTSLITSNQVLSLALGLDMGLGGNKILPMSLEYSLFPSSATVSASFISLKVGIGFGM